MIQGGVHDTLSICSLDLTCVVYTYGRINTPVGAAAGQSGFSETQMFWSYTIVMTLAM